MTALVRTAFRWVYWFPFRKLVQVLPLRVGYLFARPAARLAFIFKKRKRRLTERGLDRMTGGTILARERRAIVLKTFESYIKRGLEALWYPNLTPALAERMFVCEGLENLDHGFAEGRGVVLLHGHLGNAHMLMPALGFKGYPLSQLGSRNPPAQAAGPFAVFINRTERKIYELKLSYKEKLPVHFIYTDRSLRDALKRLRDNEVIAIAIDGREGAKWIEVDFLRHKALFSTGAMSLIIKTRPVVLPTFVVRQDDNTHRVIIAKPLVLKCTGDRENDIVENTLAFLALFEPYIYRYPFLYADAFWLGDGFFKHEAPPQRKGAA